MNDNASEAKVHILSGSLLEIRSQLLDKIQETGAEVMRVKVGKFEIALVYPGESDPVTDAEGTELCARMSQLGQVLLNAYGPNGAVTKRRGE